MSKTRVSLSLNEKLLKDFDNQLGSSFPSRSEAFEYLLKRSLGAKKSAVILAGGPAKGLWVSDAKTYRPLIKVKGRPLIVDTLLKLRTSGISEAIIIGSHEVNAAIFNEVGNGSFLGIPVKYVEEREHKGSAHTFWLAREYVKGTFLFLPCDHYFEFDLNTILEFHRKQESLITLAVYYGTRFEWTKTSLVRIDGPLITEYWEKPIKPQSHLIATMIGYAEPELFSLLDSKGALDSQFAKLSKRKKLSGCLLSGNFVNVHSKKDASIVK